MRGIDLSGKGVLVTGASSGIGRALALRLADSGAHLAVAARREDLLERLADEVAGAGGRRPAVLPVDLSVRGAAADLAGRAAAALGHVDILVNNAGGGVGGSVWVVGDSEPAREAYEVNLWSPLALTAALVPGMRERGQGLVVNVSSGAPGIPWPGFGMYASTKAALTTATETLRNELTGSGVGVLEVVPGPVDTAIQGETRLAPGIERVIGRTKLGDADTLARLIVHAMRRGRLRVVYPRSSAVGSALPLFTRWFTRVESRRAFARLDPEARRVYEGLVVRTGSQGDEIARLAREQWEAARGR